MSTPDPLTTEWVPLWDLNGGVNLDYKGAWAAGTYKDGEIVVHNGIAYLCVRQTTRTPTPWPVALPYGTSLPASPIDGQEAILVDSVTNPSYQWRFRYNAGSTSAYKWEFVGGTPLVKEVHSDEGLVLDTAWHNFPTAVNVVPPRSGEYEIFGMTRFWTGNIVNVGIGHGLGAAAPPYIMADEYGDQARITSYRRIWILTAAQQVTLQYIFSVAPVSGFGAAKYLSITPRRVS